MLFIITDAEPITAAPNAVNELSCDTESSCAKPPVHNSVFVKVSFVLLTKVISARQSNVWL